VRLVVVECECGWATRGEEDLVIAATQVHARQIHGDEITKDQVLAKARPI
jgi:predicted small metal-binding protein